MLRNGGDPEDGAGREGGGSSKDGTGWWEDGRCLSRRSVFVVAEWQMITCGVNGGGGGVCGTQVHGKGTGEDCNGGSCSGGGCHSCLGATGSKS